MTLEDFIDFYKSTYMPAYADMVGYLADKPAQVMIEIENLSVHLIRAVDPTCPPDKRAENLQKAYNHLERVTIDCLKILWIELGKDIGKMHMTGGLIKRGLRVSEDVFLTAHLSFKDLSCQARNIEMNNIGTDPKKCIALYSELTNLGWDIVRMRDDEKMKTVLSGMFPAEQMPPDCVASC